MGKVTFRDKAWDQYNEWADENPKIGRKIAKLIQESRRDPFHGTGKPEPLKGKLSGYWSRRITEEHRLIYRVNGDVLEILSCMGHYED